MGQFWFDLKMIYNNCTVKGPLVVLYSTTQKYVNHRTYPFYIWICVHVHNLNEHQHTWHHWVALHSRSVDLSIIEELCEQTNNYNSFRYRMWASLLAGWIIPTVPRFSVTLIVWLCDRTELFTKECEPRGFGTRMWCFDRVHCQHEFTVSHSKILSASWDLNKSNDREVAFR